MKPYRVKVYQVGARFGVRGVLVDATGREVWSSRILPYGMGGLARSLASDEWARRAGKGADTCHENAIR
jgi:hypothetical protein